jgi:hypothetical protein
MGMFQMLVEVNGCDSGSRYEEASLEGPPLSASAASLEAASGGEAIPASRPG